MIEITYPEGHCVYLDRLPNNPLDKLVVCASLLDSSQMSRLFKGHECKAVALSLSLDTSGKESDVCQRIENYFKQENK